MPYILECGHCLCLLDFNKFISKTHLKNTVKGNKNANNKDKKPSLWIEVQAN